jgi:hypothetical protein
MITSTWIDHSIVASKQKEMPYGLGNTLFIIASTIGIAVKNGYQYGFNSWVNQEFFVNLLPGFSGKPSPFRMPNLYKGYDTGFCGFDVPDNSNLQGYMASEKYFAHCKDLIRYYFTMKPLAKSFEDCVMIHFRDYGIPEFVCLKKDYYERALSHFEGKTPIIITDNIEAAKKAIGIDCEYLNNSPIIDFYLLSHTSDLIMANSTFSWWASWLSGAKTVAPKQWYDASWQDCPKEDLYCDNWILE